MKKILFVFLCLSIIYGAGGQTFSSSEERLEWWKDARFGLFIHWGPVSIKGTEIGWSRGREIAVEDYDALYRQFNPVNFNADEWVKLAAEAGMKYIVFTSKHHDGFCMWNTKYSEYNIMRSPFARDVMKELSEACKKYNMALGFYHSTCDWHHPDFPLTSPGGTVRRPSSNLDRYTEYLKNQSVEIINNYGPLLVMWYDVPQEFSAERGQGVIDHIRKIQPDILVNNRTGAPGDFDTPEQRVGSFQVDRPWETCMTIARQWAWKPDDDVKSLEQCLHNLIRSAGGDGNLLFNVGPKPDGTIEPLQAERLNEMGHWLKKYGYTIYETRGGPFRPADWGVSTRKGNKIYLHILKWSGNAPLIKIPDIGMEIKGIKIASGGNARYRKTVDSYTIEFDGKLLQPVNTIIEIEYPGSVMNIKPADMTSQSISFMKSVKGSSNEKGQWINHQWVDLAAINNGDWSGSFWQPAEDDRKPWVEFDLGKKEKISKAILYESGSNVKSFEFQYKSGDSWTTFHKGSIIGPRAELTFKTVDSQYIRFVVTSYSGILQFYEISLLE